MHDEQTKDERRKLPVLFYYPEICSWVRRERAEMPMMASERKGEAPSRICTIRRRRRPHGGKGGGEKRATKQSTEGEGGGLEDVKISRLGSNDNPATSSTPASAVRSGLAVETNWYYRVQCARERTWRE